MPGTSIGGAGRSLRGVAEGDEEPFADELERWLRSGSAKTIGSLGDVFAEKAYAVTILLLMLLPATPLPTGGVTHVFEAIAVLVATQMVIGVGPPWIPRRWRERELGALTTDRALPFVVRWVRRLERLSRPRAGWVFANAVTRRLLGVLLAALAAAAGLAPPFSGLDTLPALGAVLVSLAIVLEDAVLAAIGAAIGVGGTVVIVTVGTALARLLRDLL